MGQNLIEKIAQKYAVGLEKGHEVHSGEYIFIKPAHVMTHDNTAAVMNKFRSIGAAKMANPNQPVFTLDHNIQDQSEKNLEKYRSIKAFAKEMGVDFYPAGRGIGHQVMCEEGYVFPGTMVVASDSHSNMYGGLGCLGTPVVRTDAAGIWATGQTWWNVPQVVKCKLLRQLNPGVTGKDVILTLCGLYNEDQVLNHAVEFCGEGVENLSIDERLTIANMTTEWGALAGVFPADSITFEWLKERSDFVTARGLAGVPSDGKEGTNVRLNESTLKDALMNSTQADDDAYYAKEIMLDLSVVRPHVSGPHNVKTTASIKEIEGKNIKIHKAYLVSCVNSRVHDLAEAADVLKDKKVAEGVEFYVAAASSEVEEESKRRGDWQILLDAGATMLPPGCGPCIGMGLGLLEDGEVGISATNRNFKGRMGSADAEAYLASPYVVAASAEAGYIKGSAIFDEPKLRPYVIVNQKSDTDAKEIEILDGIPEFIEGEIVFCYQDNLNTDGIYPGKYTYNEDITPEEQANVAMENYDPEFTSIADKGDLLAGGYNFGTGSSREQAATALKYKGIQLILGGSFSETYKRNALNNGFLAIEAPELINDLKNEFGADKLTVRTGKTAKVNFASSKLSTGDKEYSISPVGPTAQELVLSGGLESWIKARV